MTPFFPPWIGRNYKTSGLAGLRVMILGESHYGEPQEETERFTNNWVESYSSGAKGNRFFTVVTKLLTRVPTGRPLLRQVRREFWDQVAFYNYIQRFPGASARARPTAQFWQSAEEPLKRVLADLDPQFVLVLGRDLERHVAQLIPTSIVACSIPHPSSFGFKQAEWSAHIHNRLFHTVTSGQSVRRRSMAAPDLRRS